MARSSSVHCVNTGNTTPTVIRAGCYALMALGVVSTVLSSGTIFSPKTVQCTLSRSWVEDANEDKKPWNDVDTEGVKPDKLKCDQAVRLAQGIRTDKDDPKETKSVPSKGALRTQGGVAILVGLGSIVAGLLTLRTWDPRARMAALGFAAASLMFAVLGAISLMLSAFILFALGLSRDAKWLWPRAARGRGHEDPDPGPDDPIDV